MINNNLGIKIGNKNLKDFEEIEKTVKMKDLYNCFYSCSNESLKIKGKEHRNKKDNIIEFIINEGNVTNLYKSVTYGVCPNEHCRFHLRKNCLGGYNGWFNIFLILYEKNKKDLKKWVLERKEYL